MVFSSRLIFLNQHTYSGHKVPRSLCPVCICTLVRFKTLFFFSPECLKHFEPQGTERIYSFICNSPSVLQYTFPYFVFYFNVNVLRSFHASFLAFVLLLSIRPFKKKKIPSSFLPFFFFFHSFLLLFHLSFLPSQLTFFLNICLIPFCLFFYFLLSVLNILLSPSFILICCFLPSILPTLLTPLPSFLYSFLYFFLHSFRSVLPYFKKKQLSLLLSLSFYFLLSILTICFLRLFPLPSFLPYTFPLFPPSFLPLSSGDPVRLTGR